MPHFPANWQLNELYAVIGESALTDDGFRIHDDGEGYEFSFTHTGHEQARFTVEWTPYEPDPGGYGGSHPRGEYSVRMAPGPEGPGAEYHYVTWENVVNRFGQWVSYLAREFEASEDWGQFLRIPRLLPPAPPSSEQFSSDEVEVIEPLLLQAEEDFVEVIEEELATSEDLEELKQWVRSELADIRAELKSQSKKGFRRTAFGMGANLAMKFGPTVWEKMLPIFERILGALDGLPQVLLP